MSAIERMTVTLTAELANAVRSAVSSGDYASSSEIVREALRDWRAKRGERERALAEMREFIAEGLRDIDEGRVSDLDVEKIKRMGRALLAASGRSA